MFCLMSQLHCGFMTEIVYFFTSIFYVMPALLLEKILYSCCHNDYVSHTAVWHSKKSDTSGSVRVEFMQLGYT